MTFKAREILVFEADGRLFGLDIGDVECVVPAVRPIPLPHPVPGFEGILNLRGKAVAVLDLSAWFGAAQGEIQLDDLLVVLRGVALHVRRVRGVVEIAASSVQPAQSFLPSARHFAGVVMVEGDIVFLPDVAGFLAAAENAALAEANAA